MVYDFSNSPEWKRVTERFDNSYKRIRGITHIREENAIGCRQINVNLKLGETRQGGRLFANADAINASLLVETSVTQRHIVSSTSPRLFLKG